MSHIGDIQVTLIPPWKVEADQLNEILVARVIESAKMLAKKDRDLTKWQIYNIAKAAIADFQLSAEVYEDAIKRLTEALKI